MKAMPKTADTAFTFGRPVKTVAVAAFVLGLAYSLALAYLARQLPTNPNYTALEVVGGVLLSLLPVALTARYEARFAGLAWRTYERMVFVAFAGFGLPVIFWLGIEFALRSR